ncbi:MAG: hypothetical protein NTX64_13185 [Elusimicrobia bacterium]|nr:hypothetical protein [Elusimicrobiota bacterium]
MLKRLALASVVLLSAPLFARALESVAGARPQFAESNLDPKTFGDYADRSRQRMGEAPAPVVVEVKRLEERASAATMSRRATGTPISGIDVPAAPKPEPAERTASKQAAASTLLSAARHAGLALLIIGLTGPLRRPGSRRFQGEEA